MSVTYVSALYDIYASAEKRSLYAALFNDMTACGAPFVCFCDAAYRPLITERSNLTLIEKPLREFYLYWLCSKPGLVLAANRNLAKDTQDYMALMNTKAEFLATALPHVRTSHVAWIDAGALKLVQDRTAVLQKLVSMIPKTTAIQIPGCWRLSDVPRDAVSWRFAGTFLVAATPCVSRFYEKARWVTEIIVNENRLVWEVNAWAHMEHMVKGLFEWYEARHDDSLFAVPNGWITVAVAANRGDGIGNVLKGYISALAVDPHAKVIPSSVGLYGQFEEILDERHIAHRVEGPVELFYTCRFLVLASEDGDQANIVNEFQNNDRGGNPRLAPLFSTKCIDWPRASDRISPVIEARLLRTIESLRFRPELTEEVDRVCAGLEGPMLGVSVRTWAAKHESGVDRPYDPSIYVAAIERMLRAHPEIRTVLISPDRDDVTLPVNVGDRRVVYANALVTGSPIQQSMKMILLLSRCAAYIGNRLSTFAEMVYWLGGRRQAIEVVF